PPDQAHRRRQRAALSGHWRRVFPADARDRRPARLGRAREARPGGAGSANRLERLVIDIESTQRGFIITGEPRFLGPWDDARKGFVQQAATLERWAAVGDAGQSHRAHQITQAADSYISDYAVPLVAKARQDPASARTVAVTTDGKRRVDALRRSFDRFMTREREIFEAV